MEEQLDKIAKKDGKWQTLCRVSNTVLEDLLEKVKKEKKYCIPIDETHSIVFGKYGHVVKCEEIVDNKKTMTFLSIKKGIDLDKVERKEIPLEEIVENTPIKSPIQSILGTFEGKEVKIKKGKFGLYVEWGENRKTLKSLGNRPVESITLNEIIPLLEEGSSILRVISKNITLRKGEKGNYLFYKTAKMKKPQFFVIEPFLETETLSKVKEWIKKMYDIE
jgi:DNA topoisomerase-1